MQESDNSLPLVLSLEKFPERYKELLPKHFKKLRDIYDNSCVNIDAVKEELIHNFSQNPNEWNRIFQEYKNLCLRYYLIPPQNQKIVFDIFPKELNFFNNLILEIRGNISKKNGQNIQLDFTHLYLSDSVIDGEEESNIVTVAHNSDTKTKIVIQKCIFENVDFSYSSLSNIIFVECQFINVCFKGADLSNTSFPFCTFKVVDFTHANLRLSNFSHTTLKEIIFNHANLSGSILTSLRLEKGRFRNACLDNVNLSRAYLPNTDFTSANLTNADLSYATIINSDFWQAKLIGVRGWWSQMRKSDFFMADFSNAKFWGADLSYSLFGTAPMSSVSFDSSNLQYSEFWSSDLKDASFKNTNLNYTYFSNALPLSEIEKPSSSKPNTKALLDLTGANFEGASICYADFHGTILNKVNLSHTILDGANLECTSLKKAKLVKASLKNVDLSFANLEGAILSHANISGARLDLVNIKDSKFQFVITDGQTVLSVPPLENTLRVGDNINSNTDFSGVSLTSIHMTPRLQAYLERNVREINWNLWYKSEKVISSLQHFIYARLGRRNTNTKEPPKALEYEEWKRKPGYFIINTIVNIPVKCFWKVSNYGGTTWTIFVWFLVINLIFYFMYLFCEIVGGATIVFSPLDFIVEYIKTIISGLTMNQSYSSHMLIIGTLHRICTYFILAALATRIGVLFRHLSP